MHYPTGISFNKKSNINYANRGMTLEGELNQANDYYLINDIAIIHKKPTPITIHKVNYKSRKDAVIEDARKYIDFEAKETAKNFFPLANIHEHQIKHLMNVYKHGAIAFIIVRFTKLNKTFLLTANDLKVFLENNSRKSIPFEYFKQHAYIIKDSFNPCTDYIKIVDKLISKEI